MLAMLFALCFGASADAQVVPGTAERPTYQVGRFAIDTGGWFAVSHDPNITRESKETAIGGWETHTSPQVRARTRIGTIDFAAMSALEYIKVTDPTQQAPTLTGQPNANVLGAAQAGQNGNRVDWLVDWSAKDTNARPTGFEVGARSRHTERSLTASTQFHVGRRALVGASAGQTRVGYDADAVYRSSQLSETLDKTATSGGASLGFVLTPLTSLFAGVDRRSETYHRSPIRDNTSLVTMGGISFKTGGLISGAAALGYRTSRTTFGTHPLNSPYAQIRLVHNRPSGATLAFALIQDKQFSYDADQGAVSTTSMEIEGLLPPVRGWSAYWSYERANLSYVTPTTRSETHDEYILGVSHRIFSRMRFGGFVNGYRRDAGGTTFGYSGTRVSMFVVVGATNWMRQLDLPVPRF